MGQKGAVWALRGKALSHQETQMVFQEEATEAGHAALQTTCGPGGVGGEGSDTTVLQD